MTQSANVCFWVEKEGKTSEVALTDIDYHMLQGFASKRDVTQAIRLEATCWIVLCTQLTLMYFGIHDMLQVILHRHQATPSTQSPTPLTRSPTPCFCCHPPPPFSFLLPTPSSCIHRGPRATFNRQSPHSLIFRSTNMKVLQTRSGGLW